MKRLFLFFCILFFCLSVRAQWTTSGSDIYYTTGSVSINTTTPVEKLTINGNALADKFRLNRISSPGIGCGFFCPAASAIGMYTSSLERMRVDSNGYVLINGAIPLELLSINGNALADKFRLNRISTPGIGCGLYAPAASTIGIYTNSAERVRISAAGNVGIGTTAPAAALSFEEVNTTTNNTGITWYSASSDPTLFGIHRTAGAWTAPNYQQLRIGFQTGIILDPGTAYGASYVNIMGGGLRVTAGTVLLPTLAADNTQNKIVVWNATTGGLFLRDASTLGGTGTAGWYLSGNTSVNPSTTFLGTTDNTPVAFRSNNAERMRIDVNGNILVGKTSQTNTGYVFDVNGNARANSVVVNTTGADYVFDKDYSLPSLRKIENYINEHHHLPGIAPAEEMQKKGVDLGDNQTRMLAKIEELTLYIIEQQKQIEALKEQNKKTEMGQEERISRLEELIVEGQKNSNAKPAKKDR